MDEKEQQAYRRGYLYGKYRHVQPKLKTGYVYFLKGFTAPKVFNGLYFICLHSEMKHSAHYEIKNDTGIKVKNWTGKIYKKQRLF